MSYFPKRLMPNVVKKDSPLRTTSSNRITASDYNKHSDEIIAIERFLGLTGAATEQDILDILNGDDPKNILSVMSDFVERINIFLDDGVASSSGYLHHGQRMIFPENVLVCFLTQTPSPSAKTITVNSTLGFPENGVISILNDISETQSVPHSYVEWIKYSGKDSTRFLNCERGFLGTTAGGHVGVPAITGQSFQATGNNPADQCITLPLPLTLCNRRYPGYRLKTQYVFNAYGLKDTLVNLIRRVRKYPEDLNVSPEFLGGSATNILDTAAGTEATEQEPAHPSILGRASDGTQILKSSVEAFSDIHELTWDEAEFFITDLVAKEEIVVLKTSEDWVIGGGIFIPVFNGRLSISHAIAAATMNPVAEVETVEQRVVDVVVVTPSSTNTTGGGTLDPVFSIAGYAAGTAYAIDTTEELTTFNFVSTAAVALAGNGVGRFGNRMNQPWTTTVNYPRVGNGGTPEIFTTLFSNVNTAAGPTNTTAWHPGQLSFLDTSNLLFADTAGHRIWKIDSNGTFTVFAGSGEVGIANGTASIAKIGFPTGVVTSGVSTFVVQRQFNSSGNQIGGAIRLINAGLVTTYKTDDSFLNSRQIRVDSSGNLYLNLSDKIMKVAVGTLALTTILTIASGHTILDFDIDRNLNVFYVDQYTGDTGGLIGLIHEVKVIGRLSPFRSTGNNPTTSIKLHPTENKILISECQGNIFETNFQIVQFEYDSSFNITGNGAVIAGFNPVTTTTPGTTTTTTTTTEIVSKFAETLTSLVVHQSADGRVFISSATNDTVLNRNLDQAIIQYKTFMTANNRSASDKESE